jgi:hypothetical protein
MPAHAALPSGRGERLLEVRGARKPVGGVEREALFDRRSDPVGNL